jgi:hypothetical protein
MSGVRVYLPVTRSMLRAARDAGRFGPAPLRGHAVTPALVAALGGSDEEEQEYAASTAAALDALSLLGPDDPPVRIVAAVDVPTADPVGGDAAPSEVVLEHEVPLKRLASVLADSPEAAADVASARVALVAGGAEAQAALDRCLDHELGWYAAQELGRLLDD